MDPFGHKEMKDDTERVNWDSLLEQPSHDFTPQDDGYSFNYALNEVASIYPEIFDRCPFSDTSQQQANIETSYQESRGSEFHSVNNPFVSDNIISHEQLILNRCQLPRRQETFVESCSTGINQPYPDGMQNIQGIQVLDGLSEERLSYIGNDFASANNILVSGISEEKGACFPDGMPGTSDSHNSRMSSNQSEICLICKKGFREHIVASELKMIYECCCCRYRSSKKNNLQMHMHSLGPGHFFCNTCEKVVRGNKVHDGEEICNVCNEKFYCLTLYEQHLFVHESYLDYCKKCNRNIDTHIFELEGEKNYRCCRCLFTCKRVDYLLLHLDNHTRK